MIAAPASERRVIGWASFRILKLEGEARAEALLAKGKLGRDHDLFMGQEQAYQGPCGAERQPNY